MRILALLGLSLGLIQGEPDIRAQGLRSESSLAPVTSWRQPAVEFVNQAVAPANVYLRNEARHRLFIRTFAPGERFSQSTTEGQLFVITDMTGRCLEVHRAAAESHADITAIQPAVTTSGPIIQTYAWRRLDFPGGQAALDAPIGSTTDLTFDPAGNLYITDNLNYQVYRVDTKGTLRVIGGKGFDGTQVTGLDARKASFKRPISIAVGPDESIYIGQSYTIVKIGQEDIVNKFAGLGGASSVDGGPALKAGIQTPVGLVFDSAGNLFYSSRCAAYPQDRYQWNHHHRRGQWTTGFRWGQRPSHQRICV